VILAARGLSFSYERTQVLREVSLSVAKGDAICIVGPNGAGKSTLLRLLGGLLSGYEGELTYQGRPLRSWKARELARRVAYVPQQLEMTFPYSAREVVLMGRLPHQGGSLFESERDHAAVDAALGAAEARHLSERAFRDLSGGERQLVMLASALAQEPELMLLDEPSAFLDLRHQLLMARTLRELHRERGLTLLLVSHDLDLAEALATRVVMLREGAVRHEVAPGPEGRVRLTPGMISDVFDVQAEYVEAGRERRILVAWGR
jgi:ABC-type cobalamin/Fe3+-siderophores transport system ATPase subunit